MRPLVRFGRWPALAALAAGFALVLAGIAPQMTWGDEDYAALALLIAGGGLVWELAASRLVTARARIVAGAVVIGLVLLIWAELAVGIV